MLIDLREKAAGQSFNDALALSPDASRVAVAQSDNMVVVYHLGLAKTDKKVVYRKFPTTAPVASVLWPSDVADTFFYGQIDGRVRVAHVDLNKAGTLFDRKSPLICFDCERSGTLLATGHADGSIQLCSMNASTSRATTREVYRFPVSVTAISCTAACVAAAAQTTEIALINREGNLMQLIDFRSMSPFSKEISSLAFHPSGSCLAVAAREHVRADRLSDGKSITLEAANENGDALKITEFVVYENRFLVAYTTDKQLILADVEQQKVSTITPTWAGSTRFVFDSQGVCLAHHKEDTVAVVVLGDSEIAGNMFFWWIVSQRFSLGERNLRGETHHEISNCGTLQPGQLLSCFMTVQLPSFCQEQMLFSGNRTFLLSICGRVYTNTLKQHLCKQMAVQILTDVDGAWTQELKNHCRSVAEHALADGFLDVAQFCYAILGDLARSRFLRNASRPAKHPEKREESHEEDPSQGPGDTQREAGKPYLLKARLAVFNKQFSVAEAILSENHDVDEAIEMYRNLHMFDASIRLAVRENRDVTQMKVQFHRWLMESGQEEKAGEAALRNGKDPELAVKCFMDGGLPFKAAGAIASNEQVSFSPTLLASVAAALSACKLHERAGDIFRRLGDTEKAVAAYRKGASFKKAVELSREFRPAAVAEIEEEWGDWLLERHEPEAATLHFVEAGCTRKAVQACLRAKQWKKAFHFLQELRTREGEEAARPYLLDLAETFTAIGNLSEAQCCFVQAGSCGKAVRVYVDAGLTDRGLQLAAEYLSEAERKTVVEEIAQSLEEKGKLVEAEQAYASIHEFDKIIALLRRHGHIDEMLQRVSLYRPELVEETHRELGEEMEASGNLEAAEQLYTRGGLWRLAVEMYRQLWKWSDAVRVARAEGKEAYKEVVKHLARQLVAEKGTAAACQNDLAEDAVELALDAGDFSLSLKIAEESAKHMLETVNLRQAAESEEKGDFSSAERHFVLAGKASEAIEMYRHLKDWKSAIRVASAHAPDAVPDILVSQARALANEGGMKEAEALYVEAGRADLAVAMYLSHGMKVEAVAASREHCPQLLPELVKKTSCGGEPRNAAELIELANAYEAAGEVDAAIDICCRAKSSVVPDSFLLKKIWFTAVKLAEAKAAHRVKEVSGEVARKTLDFSGPSLEVARLFHAGGSPSEAVKCLVACEEWAKAREVAAGVPDLVSFVEEAHRQKLISSRDLEALLALGDTSSVTEIAASEGAWKNVLLVAQKNAPQTVPEILNAYCTTLLGEGREEEAADVFLQFTNSLDREESLALCGEIARSLFAVQAKAEDRRRHLLSVKRLLRMRVSAERGDNKPPELCIGAVANAAEPIEEIEKQMRKCLLVSHYLLVLDTVENHSQEGLSQTAARTAVALLRYAKEIRSDEAFYRAGQLCKKAGWTGMAFFFWNRFLDIADAIDDGSKSLPSADFEISDIPSPEDLCVPGSHCMPSAEVEETRECVLAWSVDRSVSPALNKRSCRACGFSRYEATLSCPKCLETDEQCVVTGYPVERDSAVKCSSCHSAANRTDWHAFIRLTKKCPWCESPQEVR
ncbi:intraflagellar transport protein 172, putative [Toxoplasma gondii ME49]|uniref:Intraflagellar transport protein 172, putative n=3 Tax=Toxoplasma gondii TaxID=5811 RepID=S8EZM6_TOXGM|nr:intraflagellar transport protein 172, putative [Toxoplasma gondii ME49]EPT27822.1 intraflagellar transport protein 172, putative [Toxoplasma gondii ME49]|eukprot:XP_018636345.1 intraflagellar transport protein 172, putative [Toxoplasma gondii ME49]